MQTLDDCSNICIPAEADLALTLAGKAAGEEPALVAVDITAPPDGKPVALFVEGPMLDWALPPPEPTNLISGSVSGKRRFTFDLNGLLSGAHADDAALTITAVWPDDAIAVGVHLDKSNKVIAASE